MVADSSAEFLSKAPLFTCSQSPEPIQGGGGSDTIGIDTPSYLDKDYFESENPWEEIIKYF